MPNKIKWVHLTTAPDQLTAEMWKGLLDNEGIPAMVRSGDLASYLGVFAGPTRILVDAAAHEEAARFLEEQLGPEALR